MGKLEEINQNPMEMFYAHIVAVRLKKMIYWLIYPLCQRKSKTLFISSHRSRLKTESACRSIIMGIDVMLENIFPTNKDRTQFPSNESILN